MIALAEKTYSAKAQFDVGGYEAAKPSSNRRPSRTVTMHEDEVAKQNTRRKLIANTRDKRRNFSVVRWAINKHLDFVVPHKFQSRSGDKGWDKELEAFVKYASSKKRFDSAAKHSRNRAMRLYEAHRIMDGDVYGHKLRGGYLQGIEGDCIRDPDLAKKRKGCLLYTSPSPRDLSTSRMPSSA